jgi:hypothetical protein
MENSVRKNPTVLNNRDYFNYSLNQKNELVIYTNSKGKLCSKIVVNKIDPKKDYYESISKKL